MFQVLQSLGHQLPLVLEVGYRESWWKLPVEKLYCYAVCYFFKENVFRINGLGMENRVNFCLGGYYERPPGLDLSLRWLKSIRWLGINGRWMTSTNVRDSQRIIATRFAWSMITPDSACWSPRSSRNSSRNIQRVVWMDVPRYLCEQSLSLVRYSWIHGRTVQSW